MLTLCSRNIICDVKHSRNCSLKSKKKQVKNYFINTFYLIPIYPSMIIWRWVQFKTYSSEIVPSLFFHYDFEENNFSFRGLAAFWADYFTSPKTHVVG